MVNTFLFADINECEFNRCMNNGTCDNTPGSFICKCQKGFEGPLCERSKCEHGSILAVSMRSLIMAKIDKKDSLFLCPSTKLWVGIKICTSPSIRPSLCTYNPKSCVRNSSYTPWWILFIPKHSDQHDMEMTVKTAICDAASFTRVIGLCHGGHPRRTDTFLVFTIFFIPLNYLTRVGYNTIVSRRLVGQLVCW